MSLYQELDGGIASGRITSITLDVFDTVLLRRIWPEDRQFYLVAKAWLGDFRKFFSEDIIAGELYSYRIYAREEVISAQRNYNFEHKDGDFSLENEYEWDVNLKKWFSEIIELFEIKYRHVLSCDEKKDLLERMIAAELRIEKQNLRPNIDIIRTISKLKSKYRDLKVFFVSDMYLTSEDLADLFRHFRIRIFDGGMTSTEAGHTKAVGSFYNYLHTEKIFGEYFDLAKNVHIGDNAVADYKNAINAGSDAILYSKFRPFKKITTFINRYKMRKVRHELAFYDEEMLVKETTYEKNYPAAVWRSYGRLFAQPLLTFLQHVNIAAKQSPKTQFLMISSEATIFKQYGEALIPNFNAQKNIAVAEKMNRRRMIRAIVWALIKNRNFEYNVEAIFSTVNLGEVDGSRRDLYEFLFGNEYPYSEIEVEYRSDTSFIKALSADIIKADKKYSDMLKESYDYVVSFLPKNKSQKLVMVDVGWGGTVQVLFTQFANLHGYKTEVKGLYLGVMPLNRFSIHDMPPMEGYLLKDVRCGKDRSLFVAVLWEYPYTLKPQFREDDAHLEQIRLGLKDGIDIFTRAKLAPKMYFDLVVRKKIKRFVYKPTLYEVKTIGGIRFDMGFAKPMSFNIVETHLTRRQVLKMLLRHPRGTIKQVIFTPNHWPSGFMKYYRLPLIKIAVRVYGRLVGKTLI